MHSDTSQRLRRQQATEELRLCSPPELRPINTSNATSTVGATASTSSKTATKDLTRYVLENFDRSGVHGASL